MNSLPIITLDKKQLTVLFLTLNKDGHLRCLAVTCITTYHRCQKIGLPACQCGPQQHTLLVRSMILLTQLNFAEVPPLSGYPTEGIFTYLSPPLSERMPTPMTTASYFTQIL
jgi:hypothetical protein